MGTRPLDPSVDTAGEQAIQLQPAGLRIPTTVRAGGPMKRARLLAVSVAGIMILAGCGGGGGGGGGKTKTSVAGTAAQGAAIAGATLTLVDAAGVTSTATTAADGTFTIDTTGLTPPFMIKLVSGGAELFSVSAEAGAEHDHQRHAAHRSHPPLLVRRPGRLGGRRLRGARRQPCSLASRGGGHRPGGPADRPALARSGRRERRLQPHLHAVRCRRHRGSTMCSTCTASTLTSTTGWHHHRRRRHDSQTSQVP